MYIIELVISVAIVVAIFGGACSWLFWSIRKEERSVEYKRGHADYPDQRMYDTVVSLRYSDDKIHRYCNGYETASYAESKMKRESLKNKFEDYMQ